MFAVMNPPKRKRKKGKLKKGCYRAKRKVCRTVKRRGRRLPSACKGLSPEACLADYEAMGRVAPKGLKKAVSDLIRYQKAAAKGRSTLAAKRAVACETGRMYGWSAIGKKGMPKWCASGDSDRLKTAAELGYYSVNPRRRRAMKRRKKSRGSRGLGSLFRANPTAIAGYFPTMQPKKAPKILTQLIGLTLNGALYGLASSKIPYTRTGVGKYLLSAATATLLGKLAGALTKSQDIASSIMNGGMVGTGVMVVADVTQNGLSAFTNLSDYDSDVMHDNALYGYDGDVLGTNAQFNLGDFVTPPQTGAAQIMPSQAGQYPLPQSVPIPPEERWTPGGNQNWMPGGNQSWGPGGKPFNPGGNMSWRPGGAPFNPNAVPPAPAAPPGSAAAQAEVVANAAQASNMNDYEQNILGDVIGESDGAFDDMSMMG